ncbi:MAG: MFS transporter [Candidatus Wallbacteria bacterium]|nr:MFS transporter [Candidatus Wallbacteria bacterium]
MFSMLRNYKRNYEPLLKNKPLMTLIAAGFISRLGSRATYFAMLKKVYDISGGKITDLGFLTVCEALPFLIFGTIAGILIDRCSRKRVMIASDLAGSLLVVSAALINSLSGVYLMSFLSSLVYVFRQPAQMSFEPNLVTKEEIPLMSSLSTAVSSLTMILGSAMGAAVVGLIGANKAFLIDGTTLLVSALLLTFIRVEEKHAGKTDEAGKPQEFLEGIRIMWGSLSLRMMSMIDLFVTFAMAMQGMLIYFHLKTGLGFGDRAELAWGSLISASGAGVIFGSLFMGMYLKTCRNWFTVYLNILMLDAVVFLLFLFSPWFPLSMVLFAFLGAIGGAHVVTMNTTVQKTVTDEKRGKVFAAFSTLGSPVAIVSVSLGALLAGIFSAYSVLMFTAVLEAAISIGLRFTKTYRVLAQEAGEAEAVPEMEEAAA